MTITIFALSLDIPLASDKPTVVSAKVESTHCDDVYFALKNAGADYEGPAWFVDVSDPERPRWAVSLPDSEGLVSRDDVPLAVREAGEAWLVRWAGERCGREWAEQSDDTRPGSNDFATYHDWCRGQPGLPAEGDLEYLDSAMRSLSGREPTDEERDGFRAALLSELWDRTPVEADET